MKGASYCCFLFAALLLFPFARPAQCERFRFPFYAFKSRRAKNENFVRRLSRQCEPMCERESGIDYTNCVRRCMSPFCYEQIYAFDELEPGEIDVRERSFKGCCLKYWNKELSIWPCKSLNVRKTNNLVSGLSIIMTHYTRLAWTTLKDVLLSYELMSKDMSLTASCIYGWALRVRTCSYLPLKANR